MKGSLGVEVTKTPFFMLNILYNNSCWFFENYEFIILKFPNRSHALYFRHTFQLENGVIFGTRSLN